MEIRQIYGSPYWADSNIRSWLNSNASAGHVKWLCGNPPDEAHVSCGYNDYASEQGFMSNFASDELAIGKTVTQDSILSRYEYSNMRPYGSEYHINNQNIADIVQNANSTAYRERVTDNFFLLDVNSVEIKEGQSQTIGIVEYNKHIC